MTDAEHPAPPSGPPHDTRTETHSEPGHAAGDAHDGAVHDAPDHGSDRGHDDHGHAEEPLGPIDVWAWGAGALGIAVAAIMVVVFAIATGAIPVG